MQMAFRKLGGRPTTDPRKTGDFGSLVALFDIVDAMRNDPWKQVKEVLAPVRRLINERCTSWAWV